MGDALRGPEPERPIPRARSAPRALEAFEHRDFGLYWLGQGVSTAGTTMQQAAVAWQVYLLTHSAVALGLIGLVRVIPIVTLSLWGGVVADVIDRRRLLLITQSCLLLVSLGLAIATFTGKIGLWVIYVLIGIAAAAGAFDMPARQALVPSLVSRERLANALSLNSTIFQVALVIGPSLSGVLIAVQGVASVYIIDVLSYLAVLTALLIIRPPAIVGGAQRVSITAAIEGLRFVRATPIIQSMMGLDFVATFFGSATALLPIFARDILHVGSQGYGILYASPAVGAILAGLGMVAFSTAIHRKGAIILASVAAYAVFTVLFGLSHSFILSSVALAGVGASDTVSMILRQTVRQSVTPDTLRGRMASVNAVFVMGGPQLGEFEAGVLARALGAPLSVISGGAGALLAVGLITALSQLKRYSS